MAQATARFPTRPNIELRHTVDVASHNVGGGYSTLGWSLVAVEMASQPSFTGNSPGWSANVAGVGYSGAWNFDFTSAGLQSVTLATGSTNWYHSSYGTPGFSASVDGGPLGSASVSGSIGVPWVPQAPTNLGLDQPQPTSLRLTFSGNYDNGSTITGWEAQIARNPSYTADVQTVGSSGTTTFTGLSPATAYYARARGANGVGWGPWSDTSTAMTASGAYQSRAGAWVPVPLYPSNGSAWITPELLASVAGDWEPAA